MSVTVSDLLKLPSLRSAVAVAGEGGLGRVVSSISVLEASDPDVLNDNLFHNDEFFGGEIVITGFVNIASDVEKQLRHLRRLAHGGEVGLILFYVGAFVKEIDPRLITLANELDFALIKMPEKRVDLRYSDVICEVMEAIIRDQSTSGSMAIEILERVSNLPAHQRTIDTVARMLSDRLHASVILTDSRLNPLNEAAWPRAIGRLGYDLKQADSNSTQAPYIYRSSVTRGVGGMELFLISDVNPLDSSAMSQAAEAMRLALRIWSDRHDQVVVSELVGAILQDEPVRMERLAKLFKIDVTSVDMMWILTGADLDGDLAEKVRDVAGRYRKTFFVDLYEKSLVAFMDAPAGAQDLASIVDVVMALIPESASITVFANLSDTAAVRRAYLDNKEYVSDVRRMFGRRRRFVGMDIAFVKQCRLLTRQGESTLKEALDPIRALDPQLAQTVSIYLLDADLSVAKTAEILYVHKNTVKYRLKCASDRLGFHVGDMPATLPVIQAAAIERLMNEK